MWGWGEHSTALCHWAETSTQEAETIQVAWRCCFPSWDSHPSLTGPLPPSAEQGDTDSLLLPQCWNCSFSLLLLRWIRQPIHGSLEWQGNQISELKNTLKNHFFPNTAGRKIFWKPNSDLVTFLLTTLHPLGIKPRVLTEAFLRPHFSLSALLA